MLSNKDLQLIDDFVNGKLNAAEIHDVEQRMLKDKAFADEANLKTRIVKGIKLAGRNDLRAQIKSIPIKAEPSVKITLLKVFAIAASIIIIVGFGFWFINFHSYENTGAMASEINKTAEPVASVYIPSEEYRINPTNETTLNLRTGEKFSIQAGAFTDEKGTILTRVKLNIRNLSGPLEQFIAGIPTAIDSDKLVKILKPESLVDFSISSKVAVNMTADKPVQVILEAKDTIHSNTVYRLDTLNNTWMVSGTDILLNIDKYLQTFATADILEPRLENTKKERFKIVVNEEQFSELKIYKDYIFEIAPQEKNFEPTDEQFVWKSIVVRKGERGSPYKVTFANDVKTVTYQVIPVFSKEHYPLALKTYEEKLKERAADQFQGDELKKYELARLISDKYKGVIQGWFRVYQISTPGIYANSGLSTTAGTRSFTAKFTTKKGEPLALSQLALANFQANTLQRFQTNENMKLTLEQSQGGAILAITSNNQLAYLTGAEFSNLFKGNDASTIQLNIISGKVDYKSLQKLFTPEELAIVERFIKYL